MSVIVAAVKESFCSPNVKRFADPVEAMEQLESRPVDLVIADTQTESVDGLDCIAQILRRNLAHQVAVISFRSDEHTLQFLRHLAIDAWIDIGTADLRELLVALEDIKNHRRYVSASLRFSCANLRRPRTSDLLSLREEMLLSLFGGGYDNREIAARIGRAADTVRSHRSHIMHKLNLHHRGELMRYALSRGYVRVTGERTLHPGFDLLRGQT